jgi:hypothetical protein
VTDASGAPPPPDAFVRSRFDLERGRLVAGDEPAAWEASAAGPTSDAAEALERDEALLALYAGMLRDALVAVLPLWIERCVSERARAAEAAGLVRFEAAALAEAAARAGEQAVVDVGPRLTRLLLADPDQQDTTPLELLRAAARHATAALHQLGVPTVERAEAQAAVLPDDVYDLGPSALTDLDESLGEVGLRWGAAKAHVHLTRRRARANDPG